MVREREATERREGERGEDTEKNRDKAHLVDKSKGKGRRTRGKREKRKKRGPRGSSGHLHLSSKKGIETDKQQPQTYAHIAHTPWYKQLKNGHRHKSDY